MALIAFTQQLPSKVEVSSLSRFLPATSHTSFQPIQMWSPPLGSLLFQHRQLFFILSSICQEYYPPSRPSHSILSLILTSLTLLIAEHSSEPRRNTNKAGKGQMAWWLVCLQKSWAACFAFRSWSMLDLGGGASRCLPEHTHMNKGPCHSSLSPLMSSISFPHSVTRPYQPQSCRVVMPQSPCFFQRLTPSLSLYSACQWSWSPSSLQSS